jgi:hypothetical protein
MYYFRFVLVLQSTYCPPPFLHLDLLIFILMSITVSQPDMSPLLAVIEFNQFDAVMKIRYPSMPQKKVRALWVALDQTGLANNSVDLLEFLELCDILLLQFSRYVSRFSSQRFYHPIAFSVFFVCCLLFLCVK